MDEKMNELNLIIGSSSIGRAALDAASHALESSDALDSAAKDQISKAIALAVDAAFEEWENMRKDEIRRRF